MENKVREIYAEFDNRRKKYEADQADQEDIEELKRLEDDIKRKKDNNDKSR